MLLLLFGVVAGETIPVINGDENISLAIPNSTLENVTVNLTVENLDTIQGLLKSLKEENSLLNQKISLLIAKENGTQKVVGSYEETIATLKDQRDRNMQKLEDIEGKVKSLETQQQIVESNNQKKNIYYYVGIVSAIAGTLLLCLFGYAIIRYGKGMIIIQWLREHNRLNIGAPDLDLKNIKFRDGGL